MKKWFGLCLIPILMVCLSFSAAAKADHLQDTAGILENAERAELEAQLYAASDRNAFDIAVLLTDQDYSDRAETIYRSNGYGADQTYGGVLLILNTKEEDLTIYTELQGRFDALTEEDLEELEILLRPSLENRDFYGAITGYTVFCDDRATWNRMDMPNAPELPLAWYYVPVVLGVGAVAALVIVTNQAARLKTVQLQPSAVSYLREDSLRVTEREEYFDRGLW